MKQMTLLTFELMICAKMSVFLLISLWCGVIMNQVILILFTALTAEVVSGELY